MDSEVRQLHARAKSLTAKFRQAGGMSYIDEAIDLHREALELCQPGHPLRSSSLSNLALDFSIRYKRLGLMMDLDEAIVLDREALELRPPGHFDRPTSLNNLANRLSTRFSQLGVMMDLNEAIVFDREALELHPPGHGNRSMSLNNLAAHLSTRHEHLGAMVDLDEAIVLNREALELRPPGHPLRSSSLNNLAVDLSTRYEQLGVTKDLDETIILNREALECCPPGHPNRSKSLNNLAVHLSTRYEQLGTMMDLDEAIVLDREALALRPLGHPDRSSSLHNLAADLSTRYNQLGELMDLKEAIMLGRDTLALHPPGHPDRSRSLDNLAAHLFTRYRQLGAMMDLDEAIDFVREALKIRPPGHPDRSTSLNNLTHHLLTRYKRFGVMVDLDEAIILGREALALCVLGHVNRSRSLDNLAVCLSTRYKQRQAIIDLEEAIVLGRDALALRPPGHPDRSSSLDNLAVYLFARYDKRGAMMDLNEAIVLGQDALALRPPGHPNWSQSLENLARFLHTRFIQSSQLRDQNELFSLYNELAHVPQTVSSSDLFAAKEWVNKAEDHHHPTTFLAYETFFQLLAQYLATLPSLPQHLTILTNLTSSLAVNAFSACLRNHSPTNAVELLEQGRGVFWSQLTRLRSPLDDVVASGPGGKKLADEFTKLTSLIRNALDAPGAEQHDRLCHLNLELQGVVTEVRKLPGLSRFLLPPLFSDLRQASSGGPVIIVNASEYSCDALIALLAQDPVHIPLQITKERVRELSLTLGTLTVRAKRMNVARDIGVILRELWDDVVSPIVDVLQMIHPSQSRIWWCPTAEFSLLPLHAAGPYKKGQRNFTDLYISSYTPTLAALIRARRYDPSSPTTGGRRFLAIGQTKGNGKRELVSVGTELDHIGQRVEGLATFTRLEGSGSCISQVAEEFRKNEWVHLACHGLPNRQKPFESAFALHDGHFTVEHIIRCELDNPQFAYLSACHTTVGDEESPDEVIHLASAMQFAGFRSVIGTMWAVDDGETNKITSMFYENMMDESGRLDHTRAAFALRKTMKGLRSIPFDQRILYIHLGA